MNFAAVPSNVQTQTLERLIALYGTEIKRMCYLYLKDEALSSDAAQITFIKAYQKLPAFRGECSEKTWLMRIAMNTCRDQKRSAWFRHVDKHVAIEDMPLGHYELAAKDDTVLNAVMALPDKYKEVILLRYYQGMQLGEIGQALNISLSGVNSRLERAREKLRGKLERWYFDE